MRTNIFLLLIVSFMAVSTYAESSSNAGRPPTSKNPVSIDDSAQVVGRFNYSTQWIFDRPSNYLYLNVGRLNLLDPVLYSGGHFETDYGSTEISLISADFFGRLSYFASPEGTSPFRNFAFWGRYRLGYGGRSGSLYDKNLGESLPSEKNSLSVFFGQVSLLLGYEGLSWMKPFMGFSYMPYYFRVNSSLASAETQGQDSLYGPVIGAHFPVLFNNKGSLFAELHSDVAEGDSNQLFRSGAGADFGLGFVF